MNTPSIHHIPFYPQALSGVYGVNLYFGQAEKEQQRLQSESKVVYCGQYLDEYSIFHLSKGEFIVNKNHSDEHLYTLAKECAKAIYPVTILTDNKGKVMLIRANGTADKWAETRERLAMYYKGEVAEQYLNNVEAMLNDPERIKYLITKDIFFSQFFGLYRGVNPETEIKFESELYLFPFSVPLKFACVQNVEKESLYDKEIDELCVTQKGETTDSYTLREFSSQNRWEQSMLNDPVRSEYRTNYELNKTDFGINAIEGDYLVFVNGKEYYSIQMRAYRLEEREVEQETDSYFANAEKEQKERNHSFINRLKKYFNE